ncbi:leucine-rich repeat-containing protein 25 isoform X2 [Hyla sarda]|uniref:leucine-rich repeat-containing protein 25 isoform X2 n=1 Tax=Hyla sarda TaxID=327740 RepID=UPI0024C37CDA|nr:leucine-rich repeat-containing protein 25 isoform X2 [Hyla sarda]
MLHYMDTLVQRKEKKDKQRAGTRPEIRKLTCKEKKMLAVMMLMTFLYTPSYTQEASQCNTITNTILIWSQFNNCEHVMLRNKSINHIYTNKSSHYGKLTILDISNNKLSDLPKDFLSTANALKEVHLEHNELKHLPEMFLSNSHALETVTLEGNPLSEIPASIFRETLVNLTVDCRCDLVSNVMNALNYSEVVSATCKESAVLHNLKDFYDANCGNQYLALYILLPTLMLVLLVGGVALYFWKRKRTSASLESKDAADKSPAHGQSRYTSRNIESTETTFSPGNRQDYENVFVGHLTTETTPRGYLENDHRPGTHRSKHVAEEDIYLESDVNEGDQPIYTNTQGLYYNYSEPTHEKSRSHEEDDVYILPDQ